MKKMFKSVALGMIAALSLACMAGCGGDTTQTGGNDTDAQVFNIGCIGPMTGPASSYGISVRNGVETAINEINANGGINGYTLNLLVADDQHDAEKAVNAYGNLMDQGMNALVGAVTSVPCVAVTEVSREDGLLQITPSGSAAKCAQYDNCFRICFTDPQQGQHMADYIYEQGYTNCAVLYDVSDAYSSGIYNAFVEAYTAKGGTIAAAESFATGDVDFKTQLTSIKNSGADALFLPFYYTEVAYVANQSVDVDMNLPFFGCDGWDGVIKQMGSAVDLVEGAVFLTPFFADGTDEATVNFVTLYKDAYGAVPDQFAADGYDAVYAVAKAFEKAGTTDNDALVAAMHEIELAGVTGTMTWDENGDANKAAILAKIQNGGVVPAE